MKELNQEKKEAVNVAGVKKKKTNYSIKTPFNPSLQLTLNNIDQALASADNDKSLNIFLRRKILPSVLYIKANGQAGHTYLV